jgi:anaerobic selenocysteine-containing dehydrogenase
VAVIKKTVCGLCAVQDCGMNIYLENGRIARVEGMPEHPFNRGVLCPKALASKDIPTDPNRLLFPLKRVGKRSEGRWERISWDEALDTIAGRFAEIRETAGPEAVGFVRGSGPGWTSNWDYLQRFAYAFGSPNLATSVNVCFGPRALPYAFTWGGVPAPDWEHTKCMVLWAFNPFETYAGNYARRITEAKERGAKLIVIDPRFSRTAAKADIHVAPRSGTDGALALGVAHVIVKEDLYDKQFLQECVHGFSEFFSLTEEYPPELVERITQVQAHTIRELARVYATTKPAVIRDGNGIDQLTNAVQTARAIQALPVLTGNVAIRGGHILVPPLPLPDMAMRDRCLNKLLSKSISKHPLFHLVWSLADPDLIDAILTDKPYPIKALFVTGHAYRVVTSEAERVGKALEKVPFLVVNDMFMTETARMADFVLPAASFLECTRLRLTRYHLASDRQHVALQNKVVDPPGEARCDEEIFQSLARRLGMSVYFPWVSMDEQINETLKPLGITCDDLRKEPGGFVKVYRPEELYRTYDEYKKRGFSTPTQKIELYSTVFEKFGYDPLPRYIEPMESPLSKPELAQEYPLVANSGLKSVLFGHTQGRTLSLLNSIMPEPWVALNPIKANELGINDDDLVLVESPRGQVTLKAKITEAVVDPNTIFLTYGWGQSYGGNGSIVNTITPGGAEQCPISAATSNHAFLCRVRKT